MKVIFAVMKQIKMTKETNWKLNGFEPIGCTIPVETF